MNYNLPPPMWETEKYESLTKVLGPFYNSEYEFARLILDERMRKRFYKWLSSDGDKGNLYRYLVTFTLAPDNVSKADEAEQYIRNQPNRSMLGIQYYAYVREQHKSGVPHWHSVVVTDRPLKRNRFQYYEKLYGKIDCSRTKGQTHQEALNYISKESVPEVIRDTLG